MDHLMLLLIGAGVLWLVAVVTVVCLCRAAAIGDTALRPRRRFAERDLL